MARVHTGSSRRPSSVMRSSTPSRAAGIVRRSGAGGWCARAILETLRLRKSAQRYREISDDVMRWIGIESVGPILSDRPVSLHLRRRTLIRFVWVVVMVAWVTPAAFAQTPDRFDVASIKPRT